MSLQHDFWEFLLGGERDAQKMAEAVLGAIRLH
jgi:hypothetical protein